MAKEGAVEQLRIESHRTLQGQTHRVYNVTLRNIQAIVMALKEV